MRTASFVLAACLAAPVWAAAPGFSVRSGRISIQFDAQGNRRMAWAGAPEKANVLAFDPEVQDGLVTSFTDLTSFPLDPARTSQRRVTDPEFGPALEATVTGILDLPEEKIRVERTIRILLPDAFPDAALFSASYLNAGPRTLRLQTVYSQRLLLDRRLSDPNARAYEFASFQGGAYKWGEEYALIRLHADFRRSNFQGAEDVNGPEGVGGGIPFIDVWGPTMGVAIAHIEKAPQWVSLPVEVREDRRVEMALTEAPREKFRQREWLRQGERYETVLTALIFHRLDWFDALRTYGNLLRRRGIAIPDASPEYAHEPYWKSWGWLENWTVDQFLGILPELRSMGIRVANVDMGWYDHMGDWEPRREPGKFPNGGSDVAAFVRNIHDAGFKTSFWWYPLGVGLKSRIASERKDLLVQAEDGSFPKDANSMYQLCPAYAPALEHLRSVLTRAVSGWGFDGVYSDYQGLSAVPACFNPAHGHKSPLDSFQAVPKLFEMIHGTLRSLKRESLHEVCICSLPHSPYNMPFYGLANASDPVSAAQARVRIKLEKAIRGGTFAVGDCYQVPVQEWTGYSIPESFESAFGTGAQVTTFYTSLTPAQRDHWTRWFHAYRDLGLSRAEYLNLYDLAFDKPEIHVLRKGGELYYGIFADVWPKDRYRIELRGLDKSLVYDVFDYANDRPLGTVRGSEPHLNLAFKDNLLIRVRPAGKVQP